MNCDASSLRVDSSFGVPACSPFGGLGHITNCSELALSCYEGFIASSSRDARQPQSLFRGSISNNVEFEQCARRVVGTNGTYEPFYVSNDGCNTTEPASTYSFTALNGAKSTNAGFSLKSNSKGRGVMLTYLVIALTILSSLGMVAAAPSGSTTYTELSEVSSSHLARRSVPDCQSFDIFTASQTSSFASSQQLSDKVDCRTSQAPCAIPDKTYEVTLKSTWTSPNNGGSGSGTDLPSSGLPDNLYVASASGSIKVPLYVAPGQTGYLAATVPTTLFRGNLTGCKDGNNIPIEMNVIRRESIRYNIVTTNA